MSALEEIIIDESGQGLLEYSFIMSLIVLVAMLSLLIFRESLATLYEIIRIELLEVL